MVGLGGDGMYAKQKLCVGVGEHGVTMIVGKGDFPATSVMERSNGAGMSIWSFHCGKRCTRGEPSRGIFLQTYRMLGLQKNRVYVVSEYGDCDLKNGLKKTKRQWSRRKVFK